MTNQKSHVYQAICNIKAELAKEGVGKHGKYTGGTSYTYRKVEDVMAALSGKLAANQLCILPRTTEREVIERASKSGGVIFYTVVKMSFDFISAIDGSIYTAEVYGEAMDTSDKGTNKAMSAAYKYMATFAFHIPVEGTDSEEDNHEVADKPEPKKAIKPPAPQVEKPAQVTEAKKPITIPVNMVNDQPDWTSWGVELAAGFKNAARRPELDLWLRMNMSAYEQAKIDYARAAILLEYQTTLKDVDRQENIGLITAEEAGKKRNEALTAEIEALNELINTEKLKAGATTKIRDAEEKRLASVLKINKANTERHIISITSLAGLGSIMSTLTRGARAEAAAHAVVSKYVPVYEIDGSARMIASFITVSALVLTHEL